MKLDTTALIKTSWETFKAHKKLLLKVGAIMFYIQAVSFILDKIKGSYKTSPLISNAIPFLDISLMVIGVFLSLGLIRVSLNLIRNGSASLDDLFSEGAAFWPVILASILMYIGIILGLFLLIVPGLILAIGWMFSQYLIVDENLSPMEAIKRSWNITNGFKWSLFGIGIVIGILVVISMIPVGLGLLVTIPLSSLVMTYAYESLRSHYEQTLKEGIVSNSSLQDGETSPIV